MFPIDHRFVLRIQAKQFFGHAKKVWTGSLSWFFQPSQAHMNTYAVNVSSGRKYTAVERNKIKRMIRAEVMKQEKVLQQLKIKQHIRCFILYQGLKDKKIFTHAMLQKETNEFFAKMRDSARA